MAPVEATDKWPGGDMDVHADHSHDNLTPVIEEGMSVPADDPLAGKCDVDLVAAPACLSDVKSSESVDV